MGSQAIDDGSLDDARATLRDAEEAAESISLGEMLGRIHCAQGRLSVHREQRDEAKGFLKQAQAHHQETLTGSVELGRMIEALERALTEDLDTPNGEGPLSS